MDAQNDKNSATTAINECEKELARCVGPHKRNTLIMVDDTPILVQWVSENAVRVVTLEVS